MNENLNLVEILKDCPEGTKLYSPVLGEVEFVRISDDDISFPIRVRVKYGMYTFSSQGRFCNIEQGECLLFPSKDQRDWSKFKVKKPKYEEVVKHVQAYNNYKMIQKACDGLGAADAEPNLARLWHDASEEPRYEEFLLGEDTDGFSIYRWCGQEDYWETFVNETGLSRWAYIEDLLPKGGKK